MKGKQAMPRLRPAKVAAITPAVSAPLAPYPHRNLGVHLKKPATGEYVTNHHRGATAK